MKQGLKSVLLQLERTRFLLMEAHSPEEQHRLLDQLMQVVLAYSSEMNGGRENVAGSNELSWLDQLLEGLVNICIEIHSEHSGFGERLRLLLDRALAQRPVAAQRPRRTGQLSLAASHPR